MARRQFTSRPSSHRRRRRQKKQLVTSRRIRSARAPGKPTRSRFNKNAKNHMYGGRNSNRVRPPLMNRTAVQGIHKDSTNRNVVIRPEHKMRIVTPGKHHMRFNPKNKLRSNRR